MRVVICGGGYGGLAAARRLAALAPSSFKVTLVDQCPGHQLLTRLPSIIGGAVTPAKAVIPFERLLPRWIDVVRARIEMVDPERVRVVTDQGEFAADYLILALGTIPGEAGAQGAYRHATVVKSVVAAQKLRDRLMGVSGAASPSGAVIVGAGYTGTEIAGELSSGVFAEINVILVAADSKLLPGGLSELGEIAERILRARGVNLRLGAAVSAVGPTGITVGDSTIAADVLIWATPSVGVSLDDDIWRRDGTARIPVDSYLRSPYFERAFVIGDIAAIQDAEGNVVPSSAQLAIQEGRLTADNLLAGISGRVPREFVGRTYGEALSLGSGDAAAEVGGVVVTGGAALAAKRAALARYLYSLGGFRLVRRYL